MQDGNAFLHRVSGRLNAFQRAMLQWNSMHPYNAVHVVRIPGIPDQEQLRRVICKTLKSRSLTSLTLNNDRGTYYYRGGPAQCEINSLDPARSSRLSLDA